MQALRTILWVLLAVVFVSFVAINWQSVPVNFWPLADGNYLHLKWPIGFVALISCAIGFLPPWLFGRAAKWRLSRRIENLENSLKAASTTPQIAPAAEPELPAPATEPTSETPAA